MDIKHYSSTLFFSISLSMYAMQSEEAQIFRKTNSVTLEVNLQILSTYSRTIQAMQVGALPASTSALEVLILIQMLKQYDSAPEHTQDQVLYSALKTHVPALRELSPESIPYYSSITQLDIPVLYEKLIEILVDTAPEDITPQYINVTMLSGEPLNAQQTTWEQFIIDFAKQYYFKHRTFLILQYPNGTPIDYGFTVAELAAHQIIEQNTASSKLDLSRHHINSLEGLEAFVSQNIKHIDLSHNNISYVPRLFNQDTILEQLELRSNHINRIEPDAFSGCTNLKNLDLSDNKITHIPNQIIQSLGKLNILNLSSNSPLSFEQEIINQLPELELLDLSNCPTDDLPSSLKDNKKIKLSPDTEMVIFKTTDHSLYPIKTDLLRLYCSVLGIAESAYKNTVPVPLSKKELALWDAILTIYGNTALSDTQKEAQIKDVLATTLPQTLSSLEMRSFGISTAIRFFKPTIDLPKLLAELLVERFPADTLTELASQATSTLAEDMSFMAALDRAYYNAHGRNLVPSQKNAAIQEPDAEALQAQPLYTLKVPPYLLNLSCESDWSPDGKCLFVGSKNALVTMWDMHNGHCLRTLTDESHEEGFYKLTPFEVSMSPNGKLLMTRSLTAVVAVWDAHSGDRLYTLENNTGWEVFNYAWSPDSSLLATCSFSTNKVRIWNTTNGTVLQSFTGTGKLAWSPDGKYLAIENRKYEKNIDMELWDIQSATLVHTLSQSSLKNESIKKITWSPDGKYLVCRTEDRAKLWDTSSGRHIHTFSIDGDPESSSLIDDVVWNPTSSMIAVMNNSRIQIWDIKTYTCLYTLEKKGLTLIRWSRTAERFIAVTTTETAQLWDIATGECLASLPLEADSSITLSPDEKLIATESYSGVQVWQAPNLAQYIPPEITHSLAAKPTAGSLQATLSGHKNDLSFNPIDWSPNGKYIATCDDKTVKIWNTQGICIQTLAGSNTLTYEGLLWSPNSGYIAASSYDGSISIWDTTTGTCLQKLIGHQDQNSIWSLEWHPQKSLLATTSLWGGTTKIWDVHTGSCIHTFSGHHMLAARWSPDGRYLATVEGIGSCTITVWDALSGKCVKTMKHEESNGNGLLLWSPDGRLISSGGKHSLYIFDAESGSLVHTFAHGEETILSAHWSPDGRFIATGSHEKTARIWDVSTSTCVPILTGHKGFIRSIQYNPDGDYLATGSEDGAIKIWNVNSGQCLYTLSGHGGEVTTIKWNPHGCFIATSADDYTTKLWHTDIPCPK